ncbi:hypothetical protein [Pseudomonas yamanorum]|uniref:hypothetical protein n=1 Tax=Pseudomonas yamanorum TaxID=515393 RepID=UPI00087BEC50|nr:hypothetical protein [Pseudomonas yamanorum]SDU32657.1 hypothetical protein SAMN05216237_4305 [Pseudomonas yamanorum]
MTTKALHAFLQKISSFDDDLALVDVIRIGMINGDLSSSNSKEILKNVDASRHPRLYKRKNSDKSRELLVNHLRQTVYSSYVKDIYEEVTQYLKILLEKCTENGFSPGRIIGEHAFKVDAKDILNAGSWESISRMLADSVFQALEAEKSTLKLFQKMSDKLDLKIDRSLIDSALPYLEVRHFLVHSDGKVSTEFKKKNPDIVVNKNFYVQLNFSFVNQMKEKVEALLMAFDTAIVAGKMLKSCDYQPSSAKAKKIDSSSSQKS